VDAVAIRELVGPELRPWITGLIFALLGAALVEGVVLSRRAGGHYDWRAFAVSVADVAGRRLTDGAAAAFGLALAAPLLGWVYQHRLTTIEMGTACAGSGPRTRCITRPTS
jgi:hypothetical protein